VELLSFLESSRKFSLSLYLYYIFISFLSFLLLSAFELSEHPPYKKLAKLLAVENLHKLQRPFYNKFSMLFDTEKLTRCLSKSLSFQSLKAQKVFKVQIP
jgi:hypothetical protein